MEKGATLTALTQFDNSNIQTLYNKVCDKITQITPTSNTAQTVLCEIIENTNQLRKNSITEFQIGLFAFNQPTSNKNKLFNLTSAPYNGSAYVSVFFERLRQYNEFLKKNDFTSPTKDQLRFHKENQKKLTAINNAANYGLFFTQELATEKKIFTNIANTVAIQEFETLIKNISIMLFISPDEITTMATILYDDSDTKK